MDGELHDVFRLYTQERLYMHAQTLLQRNTVKYNTIQYNQRIHTYTYTRIHTHTYRQTYIQAQMHLNKDTPNLLHSYQYGLIKKILTLLLSFESSTMVLDVQCKKFKYAEKIRFSLV